MPKNNKNNFILHKYYIGLTNYISYKTREIALTYENINWIFCLFFNKKYDKDSEVPHTSTLKTHMVNCILFLNCSYFSTIY